MNNFASIQNSQGFLKDYYVPSKPVKLQSKKPDVLEVIRKRREAIKDQYAE